ncbi:hypothetical protein [Massilia sp. DWR3-1-1]|uniref:hypothetical protein n=1 Tax=Massilia sp. DWR3-1-1 TaxID=2804559 RepID=UPI003CF7334A
MRTARKPHTSDASRNFNAAGLNADLGRERKLRSKFSSRGVIAKEMTLHRVPIPMQAQTHIDEKCFQSIEMPALDLRGQSAAAVRKWPVIGRSVRPQAVLCLMQPF